MKKSVAIIGGGLSAMMLAAFLDSKLFEVSIYEKNKALGRKFLVAGKGGFNLTHAEDISNMIKRYKPDGFLDICLKQFDNEDFRTWLNDIGIPTFIGSSQRVFPIKGIKPIEVLQKINNVLIENGVSIHFKHDCNSIKTGHVSFANGITAQADFVVFALGGASWKITGSSGEWLKYFKNIGIETIPFRPSNCAFEVSWPKDFITKHEGEPLKNIAVAIDGKTQKGELVITKFGLEGNAIYALSPEIRNQLITNGTAKIFLDLKPHLTTIQFKNKFATSLSKNKSQRLRKVIKLSKPQIGLIKYFLSKEQFTNTDTLIDYIKNLPITIKSLAPIDEAISSVGGIPLDEINEHFELKKIPNYFCIGEMLDWDAPTGGYLLQACCSMGVYLANHIKMR